MGKNIMTMTVEITNKYPLKGKKAVLQVLQYPTGDFSGLPVCKVVREEELLPGESVEVNIWAGVEIKVVEQDAVEAPAEK